MVRRFLAEAAADARQYGDPRAIEALDHRASTMLALPEETGESHSDGPDWFDCKAGEIRSTHRPLQRFADDRGFLWFAPCRSFGGCRSDRQCFSIACVMVRGLCQGVSFLLPARRSVHAEFEKTSRNPYSASMANQTNPRTTLDNSGVRK
jgi:hypothetical protein